MAEVKWTARRISDGVLVDVTGDTEGTPVVAPTANALEGSGGGAIAVTDGTTTVENVTEIGLTGGTVSETSPGVAQMEVTAGEQTVSLLGPFAIAFNTAGLSNDVDPLELVALASGTILITAWLETTTEWQATSSVLAIIGVKPDPGGDYEYSNGMEFQGDVLGVGYSGAGATQETTTPGATPVRNRWIARATGPAHLAIFIQSGSDASAPTQGAGNVYAIVAVPA